jgi:hypothetical protein
MAAIKAATGGDPFGEQPDFFGAIAPLRRLVEPAEKNRQPAVDAMTLKVPIFMAAPVAPGLRQRVCYSF